jgi:hypothetical protein
MEDEGQIAEKRRIRAEKKAERKQQAANLDPTVPASTNPIHDPQKARQSYKLREMKPVAPGTIAQSAGNQSAKSVKIMTWNVGLQRYHYQFMITTPIIYLLP